MMLHNVRGLDAGDVSENIVYGAALSELTDAAHAGLRRGWLFFFFQAEDSIRDHCVTEVQTCALPISYGLIAYSVTQRIQELGIRIALGAQRRDVLRLVLGQGTRLTLLGLALGIAAALGITRLITSLLFGTSPTDPLTFAGVAGLLVFVALLACFIPARRATRIDPIVALRYE